MTMIPARLPKEATREARRRRSARLLAARKERWAFRLRRLRRAFVALLATIAAVIAAGLFMDGISDGSLVLVMLLGPVLFLLLAIFPRAPRPRARDLDRSSLAELAGATEVWLEAHRPSLPAAALDPIALIEARLEGISPQLGSLDETAPGAREIRKLLSQHLPSLVETYARIPSALRGEAGVDGKSPSDRLVGGLCVIADAIGAMSHDLSRGDIDRLATHDRFLELKYLDADAPGLEP